VAAIAILATIGLMRLPHNNVEILQPSEATDSSPVVKPSPRPELAGGNWEPVQRAATRPKSDGRPKSAPVPVAPVAPRTLVEALTTLAAQPENNSSSGLLLVVITPIVSQGASVTCTDAQRHTYPGDFLPEGIALIPGRFAPGKYSCSLELADTPRGTLRFGCDGDPAKSGPGNRTPVPGSSPRPGAPPDRPSTSDMSGRGTDSQFGSFNYDEQYYMTAHEDSNAAPPDAPADTTDSIRCHTLLVTRNRK